MTAILEERQRAGKLFRWTEFARLRKKGGGRPALNQGYGVAITFEQPVTGPISLGYGAHFGLGLFVPDVNGLQER